MAKSHYRNLSDVAVEIVKSLRMTTEELGAHVTFLNPNVVTDFIKQNQPVLVVVGHHCNQEWAIFTSSQNFGASIDVVYKRLHINWLDELSYATRTRLGANPVAAKECLMNFIQRKNELRVIAMAADQAPRKRDKAYWTQFLNQKTPFYLGAETIAKALNYPVVFMGMRRVRRGHYQAYLEVLGQPPYSKTEHIITENYVRNLERQILERPEDWYWMHRRWKIKNPLYA